MRRLLLGSTVLASALLFSGERPSAQNLSFSLFGRYLDSLRVEAGIPGLSASVLQDGETVWEQAFGRQNLESSLSATTATPYVVGDLSQTFAAALLLKKCVDEGSAELSDRVVKWAPFPEVTATIRDVLTHSVPGIGFRFDTPRFARLTSVVEECADVPYRQVLVEEVFERLGMTDSAPGHSIDALTAVDRATLGQGRLLHYTRVLRNLAVPYRVDPRTHAASRTTLTAQSADGAMSVVSTVRDLARFDSALDAGVLMTAATRDRGWTQASPLPTGFGWFVQAYNGEPLVWQFGLVKDSYSSLILKAPNRGLTLILLANSDGLNAPFALEKGDVTTSLFAKLFLRLLVV